MDVGALINNFVTFFVTMDPIGIVPLFLGMTHHLTVQERKRTAMRAMLIAGMVLISFALFGHLLLEATGVKMASFKIAGGIILFLVGVNMLFSEDSSRTGSKESGHDIAVFPLAIPYIAGPGTMLAAIVVTRGDNVDPVTLMAKLGIMVVALIVTGIILMYAGHVQKYLGKTGCSVIERVMGIILAAMATESVIAGITELKLFGPQ
jgi:multiple antibiotic resistance protein